jgi:hypothetical protein
LGHAVFAWVPCGGIHGIGEIQASAGSGNGVIALHDQKPQKHIFIGKIGIPYCLIGKLHRFDIVPFVKGKTGQIVQP